MNKFLNAISETIAKTVPFFTVDIWKADFSKISGLRAFIYHQILLVYFIIRAFVQDKLLVRASALVYATLLSLVPLLAIVFSLLKAFGFHNRLEPTMLQLLQPLGQNSAELIVKTILQFVDNANVGALGGIGLLVLFTSIISIINNIDRAFNDIWKVHRGRSLRRRIVDYSSVILLGPVLLFAGLGITASLQSNSFVQWLNQLPGVSVIITKSLPILASWLAFFFMIMFVPNTRVKLFSATFGAIVGGTMWQLANTFFARFIVASYQSGAKAALYAGFATLPLFLIWLYLSWSIVLLAAEIAYAHQNLKKITWEIRSSDYSYSVREELALKIVLYVAGKFTKGEKAPTSSELADYFNLPERLVNNILFELIQVGFLFRVEGNEIQYSMAKSPEKLTVADILLGLRNYGISSIPTHSQDDISKKIGAIYSDFNESIANGLGKFRLVDLLD